jgi:glycosyltransferase involved in cell wall biosynthesis
MNVAIFTDNDFDPLNGVTTALRAALERQPQGLRLRVYTNSVLGVNAPHYLALAAPALPVPFCGDLRVYVPRVGTFLRHAREDRIGLIHLTSPGPVGVAAMRVASALGIPMIGSFHTDLAACTSALRGPCKLSSWIGAYTQWLYGRCCRILVPSEHTRGVLVGAGTDPDRVDVWPAGVNTDLFSPHRRMFRLRERWHVAENRPALLYVGRLSREKGVNLLPGIQDRLHALGIQHRFVLVGEGPLRDELRSRMPDAVFAGVLIGAALAEVYASADFFVFPSRTDTTGNAVLEAQASGLPIAVSDAGGPREYILAGRTGIVCCGDNPAEWAEQIAGVLRPRLLRCEMGRAARDYAITRDWDSALHPLFRAYREVAAAGELVPAAQREWVTSGLRKVRGRVS